MYESDRGKKTVSSTLANSFRVGDITVDRDLNVITRDGVTQVVEPKVMEVLYYLAERPNEVISRYELMDELWQANVSDGAVSRVIGLLRKALGDSSEAPQYIQTVAKKGYRLIAPVSALQQAPSKSRATGKSFAGRRGFAAVVAAIAVGAVVLASWLFSSQKPTPLIISKPQFVQLTSDQGFEYDATLSLDENWLLYRHRPTVNDPYNLYLKKLVAQEVVQLTDTAFNEYSPAFSRDQRKIAFFSKGQDYCRLNMLVLDAEGHIASQRELYKCGAFDHYSNVVWAPDGASVYFTDRASENVPYQIFSLQVATGRIEAVTQSLDNYYGDNELSLSPSGRYLAFFRNKYWGNNEVYVLDLETGEERKVRELGFLAWNISWTKDEQYLLFSDNRSGGELNQIDVTTGEIKGLYFAPQAIGSPELSASGSSIIYATQLADVDLWQQSFSDPKNVSKAEKMRVSSSRIDMNPVVSPSGQQMLFQSDRNGGMQLWLSDTDALVPMSSLPSGIRIDHYAWHPVAPQVVVGTSDKRFHLLDTEKDTSEPLDLGAAVAFPEYSSGGDTLYYTSDKSGDWQLWAVDMLTGEQTQLTQRGGYRVSLSPDGQRLFFTKYREQGIWELDLATGAETLRLPEAENRGAFATCSDALVYLEYVGVYNLVRHDLKSGSRDILMTAPRNAKPRFDVAGDCERLVFSKYDNVQSDIAKLVLR